MRKASVKETKLFTRWGTGARWDVGDSTVCVFRANETEEEIDDLDDVFKELAPTAIYDARGWVDDKIIIITIKSLICTEISEESFRLCSGDDFCSSFSEWTLK